jgi:colicin import membrane protein
VKGRAVAEVEINVAPDGSITGRRLTKSSGESAWDEAVLRAIDLTAQLPRDGERDPPPSIIVTIEPPQ